MHSDMTESNVEIVKEFQYYGQDVLILVQIEKDKRLYCYEITGQVQDDSGFSYDSLGDCVNDAKYTIETWDFEE